MNDANRDDELKHATMRPLIFTSASLHACQVELLSDVNPWDCRI